MAWFLRAFELETGGWACRSGETEFDQHADLEQACVHLRVGDLVERKIHATATATSAQIPSITMPQPSFMCPSSQYRIAATSPIPRARSLTPSRAPSLRRAYHWG
jgi:hypothetical protein